MAKASEPGRTKTRLVPPLTHQEASAFNTAFLRDVASNILAAAECTSVAGYMAFGPPGSAAFFNGILTADIGLFESWHPNFGDCLFGALDQLLKRGHAAAIVLNSDGPTLPTSLLIEAAEVLARPGDNAVLGPTEDGGYYLLGVKANHRRLFEHIDWSTERVARQTLARAEEIALPVHLLATWYDVDDTATLTRVKSELIDGQILGGDLVPFGAPQTADLIRVLLSDDDFSSRLGWAPGASLNRAFT
jgi:rSAM/selenodomain-associated transferase 1